VKKIVSSIKLKVLEEEVVKYALNNEQLKLIREFPIDEGSPLCKARDMFMVVCYTGMRFGDLETLEKKHILTIGDLKVLKRKAIKTSNKVYEVELHPYVVELLEKYNYKMNLMTNGKANEYIKKVLAGIDEFCTESNLYFGDDGLPKKLWELIGFHQGRRTFITNLFKKGLNPFQVMKRTDHTKISTLEDYIAPSKDNYEKPEELFGFC
jgi:integrase